MIALSSLRPLAFAAVVLLVGWTAASTLQFTLDDDHADSRLWVSGTSTVHDWECEAADFSGTITATSNAPDDVLAAIREAEVVMPATQLSCKNGTMDEKAHDALEASQNPLIRYQLTEAELVAAEGEVLTIETRGLLSMAGAERPVAMQVEARPLPEGDYQFTGSTALKLSDFGMKRPSAMFGTIKTGDEVTVHFDVRAEVQQR